MTRGGDIFLPSRRKVLYGIAAATGLGTLSGPALGLQEHTLTIRGVGERAEYEFAVSGEVVKGPQADGGDRILDGSAVRGAVGGEGADDYRFTGQFTAFRLDGRARVFVDGTEVELRRADDEDEKDDRADDGDDELPNTITLEAGDRAASYQFTVSGRVALGPNVDPAEEIVDGDTARGTIGPVAEAKDDFRFSGRITSFELDGPGTVFVNGRRVDDPVGQPADRDDEEEVDDDETPSPDAEFVLRQGDTCVPLSPLSAGDQSVTAFYDYDPSPSGPNVRQSNTGLERASISRLFLYEGPDGLSLVFIHGGTEDEQGGSASFEVAGLPSGGDWVVLDDSHEGTQDVFDVGGSAASLHWAWGVAGRSDGAVFRGLTGDAEVRVVPAFNEAARRDPLGPGQVERWQVLSGSVEDPEVTNLALDEPVVISAGSC